MKNDSPDPIEENIETLAHLHKRAERKVSLQQRAIETVTAFLSRPRFLFIILTVVSLWMLVNAILARFGLPDFDPPPYPCLSMILSLGALLQTTVVLITQDRQDKVAQRRRELDLHISLLLDQKMSKLIDMVDTLRKESVAGPKQPDQQAEAMKKAADPHQVLSTLDQLLREDREETEGD
jgi:uncharacterized membrane protein